MGQSLAQLYVHIVFSTRDRAPYLRDEQFRKDLHAYIAGHPKRLECPALMVGGVEDHVHALCVLSKNLGVAPLVRDLKRDSSKWVKDKQRSLAAFSWQSGYGAFSISPGHVDVLKEYIRNQAAHHRMFTFQQEYRRLLKKYGIEWDEQYVWD